MNKCTIQDCARPVVAKNMCDLHYRRVKRNGHTENTRPKNWGKSEKHPLYRLWCGMRRRCNDVKCKSYPDYGGRGIKVCTRWNSFWNFVEDMGDRPSKKHQIERINNNKGYEPNNCRWATAKEQARNRRNNVITQEIADEIKRRRRFGDRICDIAKSLNIKYSAAENVVRQIAWKD